MKNVYCMMVPNEIWNGRFTIDELFWDRCFRFHLYCFSWILIAHKVSSIFVQSSSQIAAMSDFLVTSKRLFVEGNMLFPGWWNMITHPEYFWNFSGAAQQDSSSSNYWPGRRRRMVKGRVIRAMINFVVIKGDTVNFERARIFKVLTTKLTVAWSYLFGIIPFFSQGVLVLIIPFLGIGVTWWCSCSFKSWILRAKPSRERCLWSWLKSRGTLKWVFPKIGVGPQNGLFIIYNGKPY